MADKKTIPMTPAKEKAPPKDKTSAEVPAKAEAKPEAKSETKSEAAAPANYSRGEGQKVVSQAYKDNWNAIYGKKSKKKKR
jgi:hypothetical protein